MDFFTVSAIIAICCVYDVEKTSAGSSITKDSVSQSIDSAAKVAEIAKTTKELAEAIPNKKGSKSRKGRSTSLDFDFKGSVHKFTEAADVLLKRTRAFVSLLNSRGNTTAVIEASKTLSGFRDSTVRPFAVTTNAMLKTLNGPLIGSFRQLLADENNLLNKGDIISCRLPGFKFAEHYMMVYNDSFLAEVGVDDATGDGSMIVRPFTTTHYYYSDQCLYHTNVIIEAAISCDEKQQGKKKKGSVNENVHYHMKSTEILDRLIFTGGGLSYSKLSCNCQDLVLYWAYGLVSNHPCIAQFRDGKIVAEQSIQQLEQYVQQSC